MSHAIINTAITFIVSSTLGYCVSLTKGYKKKLEEKGINEKTQNKALLMLIQNSLTNTFFVYNELKEIPDYVFRNWENLFSIYKLLGGNDYCETLKNKMKTWNIVKTDIL